ncbi:MAG: EamA family transporter [Candidatus Dormiibacterota bacterium]|jgi:drug/metabolite transporter (DMT)-like permease
MTVDAAPANLTDHPKLRSWLALAAVYVLWGSTYAGIQVAIRYLPPLLMSGTRFMIAGLVLYLIAGHQGSWRSWPPRWEKTSRSEAVSAGLVGLFLLFGGNGLVTVAELKVHSGIAALMIATVPLWMTLIGLVMRWSRSPGVLGWLGVVVGLAGVAVLVDPSSSGHLTPLLASALLGSAILWSIGSLYSRRAPLAKNILLVSAVELIVGGLALVLVGLASGEASQIHWDRVGPPALIAFTWLVTGGSVIGYSCYTYALKMLPPTTVATYAYVNPVVALVLGWLILNQGLTAAAGIAAFLITLGVVLMVSGPELARRRARARLAQMPPI